MKELDSATNAKKYCLCQTLETKNVIIALMISIQLEQDLIEKIMTKDT